MHISNTDAYKLRMAYTGFPLRIETFNFSFRWGGPQYIGFDIKARIQRVLDSLLMPIQQQKDKDETWCKEEGYVITSEMKLAMASRDVEILAAPKGSTVLAGEPIVTITGPSALVSWLEPHIIRLHYLIQLSTKIHNQTVEDEDVRWIGQEHRDLIEELYSEMGMFVLHLDSYEDNKYYQRVHDTAKTLIEIVGNQNNISEQGFRSSICDGMHEICLRACHEAGIRQTSNAYLARKLNMIPYGSTGHEQMCRFGNDYDANVAMRDRHVDMPSYLPDTFDILNRGIPAIVKVWEEIPHKFAIRYDCDNSIGMFHYANATFQQHGIKDTVHAFADSLDFEKTRELVNVQKMVGDVDFRFGYGHFLTLGPAQTPLTRNRVSAVYKLSNTAGKPIMKCFGSKASLPGVPVIWRSKGEGPYSVVGQKGEKVPDGYYLLSGASKEDVQSNDLAWKGRSISDQTPTMSPETQRLIVQCRAAI